MIAAAAASTIAIFSNLSLSDALVRATANSAAVQSAIATVTQKASDLTLARIAALPHFSGDYSLAPQAGPLDVGTVEQHFISVGAGISLTDLVNAPNAVHAAASDLVAAQRNAAAAELASRKNAITLYFTALQAIAVERIRKDALQGAQGDLRAAMLRNRNGEAPALDVLRASVTLAQARADLARAQADRAGAVAALAAATAVDPGSLAALTQEIIPPPTPIAADRAVARALALRPELASLLANLAARKSDLAAARTTGIATATIAGGYQAGVDTGIPARGPQVAAHVDVPFASPVRARVVSVQAQVDATYAQLAEERRTIALEVAGAVRDDQAYGVAAQAAQEAQNEAAAALSAVEIGYREGASSSLDLAVARRAFEEARIQALVAAYDRARAAAILEVVVP